MVSESEEAWASLLRDLRCVGMPTPGICRHRDTPAVVLAIGDGALGFWAAVRKVYPQTKGQRCWVHKIRNVLSKLPKRLQKRAKAMLHEIMYAENRDSALEEIHHFESEYGAKYPKAVECLTSDQDALLTFFDFPGHHWIHLRTTNPIESTFSTVRARTRKTKGAGARQAGLAMAFKLVSAAQDRWRRIRAPHLVALVHAGVEFKDGEQVKPEQPVPVEILNAMEVDFDVMERIAA